MYGDAMFSAENRYRTQVYLVIGGIAVVLVLLIVLRLSRPAAVTPEATRPPLAILSETQQAMFDATATVVEDASATKTQDARFALTATAAPGG